ncbi:hypothetical protein [Brevibacterium sp. FME37]|uniref:hypothetical protein n=1 Tax=Brevibacterium sp. FME37 TaxID=2742607 RepID=UPI0018682660|nr:hypothetical protein [Brevibacterium sp. FME37]
MTIYKTTKVKMSSSSELYDCDIAFLPSGRIGWVGAALQLAEGSEPIVYPGAGPGVQVDSYSLSVDSLEAPQEVVLLIKGEGVASGITRQIGLDFSDPEVRQIANRVGLFSSRIEAYWVGASEVGQNNSVNSKYYVLDDGYLYIQSAEGVLRILEPGKIAGDSSSRWPKDAAQYEGMELLSYAKERDHPEWPILVFSEID